MAQLGYSIKRISEEIKKCEIVCANCHAIRTHERRNKQHLRWACGRAEVAGQINK